MTSSQEFDPEDGGAAGVRTLLGEGSAADSTPTPSPTAFEATASGTESYVEFEATAPSTAHALSSWPSAEALDCLAELERLDRVEAECKALRLEAMQTLRLDAERRYRASHPHAPELTSAVPQLIVDGVVEEIAAVRGLSRGVVQAELSEAAELVRRLPITQLWMLEGDVRPRHASVIIDEAGPVVNCVRDAEAALRHAMRTNAADAQVNERWQALADAETAMDQYEDTAVAWSREFTPATLRARLARLAARLSGASGEARRVRALNERRVWLRDEPDGMKQLCAILPAFQVDAIHDRLTQQARALSHVPGEDRSFDQLRADTLADLLLTGDLSGVHAAARGIVATIAVTVPVLTVLGHDTEPATLNGVTPIPMATALDLAASAPTWLRVLTDPITGVAREVDTYRPTAAMRALIRARDVTCRFMGCNRAARRCDIDHAQAWHEGGATSLCNLECLCRHHHGVKHGTGWSVRHFDRDEGRGPGDLEWVSPLGRRYTNRPPPIGPTFTTTKHLVRDAAPAPARDGPTPF